MKNKKYENMIFKGKINMKLNPNLEAIDQLDWLGNINCKKNDVEVL